VAGVLRTVTQEARSTMNYSTMCLHISIQPNADSVLLEAMGQQNCA